MTITETGARVAGKDGRSRDERIRAVEEAAYRARHHALDMGEVQGQGYVGHPALGDPAFARATSAVLLDEAMTLVTDLLDGRAPATVGRSPFFAVPVFRTNFWPAASLTGAAVAALAWLRPRRRS